MIQHAEVVGISRLVDEKLNLALHTLSFPGIALLVALKLLVDLLDGTSGSLVLVLLVVLIHGARGLLADGTGQSTISGFLFILVGVFIIVVAGGVLGAGSLDLSCLEGTHGPLVQWVAHHGGENSEERLGIVTKDRGSGFGG